MMALGFAFNSVYVQGFFCGQHKRMAVVKNNEEGGKLIGRRIQSETQRIMHDNHAIDCAFSDNRLDRTHGRLKHVVDGGRR